MKGYSRNSLSKLVQELAHGALYGAVFGVVLAQAFLLMNSWSPVLAWGTAVLSYVAVIAVHEAGHALAGKRVGYRTVFVEVWPVRLVQTISGWRIRRSMESALLGGMTVSLPVRPPYRMHQARWFLLGGPVASVLVGLMLVTVTACLLSASVDPGWDTAILLVGPPGLVSLWLGLISLIPFQHQGSETDGAGLWEARKLTPEIERAGNLALLMGASSTGVRPRDWDAGLIDSILNGPDDLNTSILGSAWAYDHGEFERALEYYESALTQVGSAPPRAKAAVAVEAAFLVARVRGDAVRGRELLDSAGRERVPKTDRLRAEAAILLAEGRPVEACACARGAITALRESFLPGFAIAERDWLEQLIAEATDPSRVEPALPAG